MTALTIVGVGEDGCAGLCARAVNAVARAQVLVGGARQLAFFPQFQGERRVLRKGAIAQVVREVVALSDECTVVVLASGDPLYFGIGGLIAKQSAPEYLTFIPQPSSAQIAFAKLGLPWQDALMLSVHGRGLTGVAVRLRKAHRAAMLTDDDSGHPARVAAHLVRYGVTGFQVSLCERLGATDERVRAMSLEQLTSVDDVRHPALLVFERISAQGDGPPVLSYAKEESFARRTPKLGLITKREVRCLALAMMNLRPSGTVWDVGTGSGAIAVEAGLVCDRGQVYAADVDSECVEHTRSNAMRFGSDNVQVVLGRAPEVCSKWPHPDAVFIGGSRGGLSEIVKFAWARLRPGGRLVVSAITLDNVAEAGRLLRDLDCEVQMVMVQVSRGVKLAHYLRYDALNPVHLFSVSKPGGEWPTVEGVA